MFDAFSDLNPLPVAQIFSTISIFFANLFFSNQNHFFIPMMHSLTIFSVPITTSCIKKSIFLLWVGSTKNALSQTCAKIMMCKVVLPLGSDATNLWPDTLFLHFFLGGEGEVKGRGRNEGSVGGRGS